MHDLIIVNYNKWPCPRDEEKYRVACMENVMDTALIYVASQGDPSYFRVPYSWLDSRMDILKYNAFTHHSLPIKFHKNIKYCLKLVYQTFNNQGIALVTIQKETEHGM